MKQNLSDYFPVHNEKDFENFEKLVDCYPEIDIPENGFTQIMAAKEAINKLTQYRQGQAQPTSLKVLASVLGDITCKGMFKLAQIMGVELNSWRKVLLSEITPLSISAKAIAKLADKFDLSFLTLKEAIIGSFQLFQTGTNKAGNVFTRSKGINSNDLNSAIEELILKGAGTKGIAQNSDLNLYLKEVQGWMRKT